MSKKEITYMDLVKVMLTKARDEANNKGEQYNPKEAFSNAASRWKQIKNGSDPEFSQGSKTSSSKSKQSKPVPAKGHKGAPSITRPGHKDFRTAKGFKYYHRDGHLEDYNEKGVKGTPYTKKGGKRSRRTKSNSMRKLFGLNTSKKRNKTRKRK